MIIAATRPEAIFEQARLVREMAALVEKFLAGGVTREELQAWALAATLDGKRIRFRNPRANILYQCLCGLDEQSDQTNEPVVRSSDLATHHRDLRSGLQHFPRESPPVVAVVKLSAAEIARRTGADLVRFWWEGLGWYEEVCFTSASMGTAFRAVSPHDKSRRQELAATIHVWPAPPSTAERSWILAVLFDALCIDDSDATSLWAPLALSWDLMRQDDNGHKFRVASFTGYAKARARIEQFDATQHKQLYWLEERVLVASFD